MQMNSQRFKSINCEKLIYLVSKVCNFGWQICYFYISNILLANDAICIWLLIGQSNSKKSIAF